jgi:hypothetical protein
VSFFGPRVSVCRLLGRAQHNLQVGRADLVEVKTCGVAADSRAGECSWLIPSFQDGLARRAETRIAQIMVHIEEDPVHAHVLNQLDDAIAHAIAVAGV